MPSASIDSDSDNRPAVVQVSRLIPCRELPPSLPVKPKRKTRPKKAFTKYQLFGFDTETTVDGRKELQSYQPKILFHKNLDPAHLAIMRLEYFPPTQ